VYGWLVFSGERQAITLNRPFRILDWNKPEPASLIPELGHLINKKFPERTTVICNFFAHYGPQLEYYAQRTILSHEWTKETSGAVLFHELRMGRNFSTHEWTKQTEGAADNTPVGGVIWFGKPDAKEILAALPSGSREKINVRGIPFCFWKPDR
jgi:hypothetical protein